MYILKKNQTKLLKADLGEFFDILREFYDKLTADELIDGAIGIDITREQIVEFEEEYNTDPDQDLVEFIK